MPNGPKQTPGGGNPIMEFQTKKDLIFFLGRNINWRLNIIPLKTWSFLLCFFTCWTTMAHLLPQNRPGDVRETPAAPWANASRRVLRSQPGAAWRNAVRGFRECLPVEDPWRKDPMKIPMNSHWPFQKIPWSPYEFPWYSHEKKT